MPIINFFMKIKLKCVYEHGWTNIQVDHKPQFLPPNGVKSACQLNFFNMMWYLLTKSRQIGAYLLQTPQSEVKTCLLELRVECYSCMTSWMYRDRNRKKRVWRKIRETGVSSKFGNQSIWAVTLSWCLLSEWELAYWLLVAKRHRVKNHSSSQTEPRINSFCV